VAQGTNSTLRIIWLALVIGAIAVGLAYMIASGGVPTAAMLIMMPIAVAFAAVCIARPKLGLIFYIHCSFFNNGLFRFFPPTIPYGLMIDAILGVCILGTFFNAKREDLKRLNNPFVWLTIIWFGYTLIELVNPEARSREAWFYAVRGVSMYWVQTMPLLLIWMNKREDMEKFIRIWLGWSFVAAMWGFKQQYISLTPGEVQWLEDGAKLTHILMGKLRSFSFYSDAGQFGAAMAHASLFCLIMGFGVKNIKKKIIYLVLAFIYFWGFAVAGSRGPLFVLAAGFLMYLFMIRNFKVLAIGLVVGAMAFVTLKYTTVGQSNYQIQRMRSALDPNDASFQVRLENQAKLRVYLKSRPLGGGIGSGGGWGQRFTPGTFLAETALDSWYVKIWVETGVIGLWIHIIQLIIIFYLCFKRVFFLVEETLRLRMIAILCGFFGIAVASYGNQVFGQLPTSTIIYFSMIFCYLCEEWDTPEQEIEKPEPEPNLLW
jgi:hypothetical protein